MKEIVQFRINFEHAHRLFLENEGRNVGTSVRVVDVSTSDPRYSRIHEIDEELSKARGIGFYTDWKFKREYSKEEIEAARLFHFNIRPAFEPAGEDCGTIYDESVACEICKTGGKQIGPLHLKKNSIPRKAISKSIAGEVVVSDRFVQAASDWGLRGVVTEPVYFKGKVSTTHFQMTAPAHLEMTGDIQTGDDPFVKSYSSDSGSYMICGYEITHDKEVYVCPRGHLLGLNLISEPYVFDHSSIDKYDLFSTVQKLGVRRGFLRPQPIYLCSPKFRKMVIDEKLSGFEFEIARTRLPSQIVKE